MPIVVLFADIHAFSALAENMEPGALSTLLAEFREILSTTIRDHGGVVDKFIGDAVMAVFGFPDTGNAPPNRAINCALAILDGVAAWSSERERTGLPVVETGIGLHYGEAFVGVIGKDNLLEFTVIGNAVICSASIGASPPRYFWTTIRQGARSVARSKCNAERSFS